MNLHDSNAMQPGLDDPPGASFNAAAIGVSARLRDTFSRAVVALRIQPDAPQELLRRLGLDKSLAWRLARMVKDEDPLRGLAYAPGPQAQRLLCAALRAANAHEPDVLALEDAWRAHADLIRVFAGDRRTLEQMLAPPSLMERAATNDPRRLMFEGASAIWGVRAALLARVIAVAPSPLPQFADVAHARGLIGFHRLRPDVVWPVLTLPGLRAADSPNADLPVMPLAGPATGDPPLLHDFCTAPPPPVVQTRTPDGAVRFDIDAGPVGAAAAVHCVFGWRIACMDPRAQSPRARDAERLLLLDTPAEEAVFDLYIHRDLRYPQPPRAAVFSQLPGDPAVDGAARERGLLPLPVTVAPIEGDGGLRACPDLGRLGRAVCDSLQRSFDDFRGYRCRLACPPIGAALALRHPLEPA